MSQLVSTLAGNAIDLVARGVVGACTILTKAGDTIAYACCGCLVRSCRNKDLERIFEHISSSPCIDSEDCIGLIENYIKFSKFTIRDVVNFSSNDGKTFLMLAAEKDNCKFAEYLLNNHANANAKHTLHDHNTHTSKTMTALTYALNKEGRHFMVDLLVEHGANPDIKEAQIADSKERPVREAYFHNNFTYEEVIKHRLHQNDRDNGAHTSTWCWRTKTAQAALEDKAKEFKRE